MISGSFERKQAYILINHAEEIINYLKEFVFVEGDDISLIPEESNTIVEPKIINGVEVPKFINEYWTSRQRQSSSIHEISYRACFKAQLPRFFIKLLTERGDTVYDPFSGRGTTIVEAAILGRGVISNDINPLSRIISRPRLSVPEVSDIVSRLESIVVDKTAAADIDLSMFYHPETEAEIVSLRSYLIERAETETEDEVDSWIRMVATNRLTGHSPGFFSVYTLPPNQAVSQESQVKINSKRNQKPDYRDTKKIIIRKTNTLLKRLSTVESANLRDAAKSALFIGKDARETNEIDDNVVSLTITSPPFLDVVQYSQDNWLRCWFNGINTDEIEKKITMSKKVDEWTAVMEKVFKELNRITKPGGWVAFEVGEVKKGKINLEDYVIPLGLKAGFKCIGVIINLQEFTKTSNIWGINNNKSGTNSNRIALFQK